MERDGARRQPRSGVRLAGAAVLVTTLVAACSAHRTSPGPGTTCGTARTAAGVPVIIKVVTGSVACSVAVEIEDDYAAKIRAGQVAGNGGGAPVTVSGWTCQGFNTPQTLSTGNTSRCRRDGTSILAVLPVSTPSARAA